MSNSYHDGTSRIPSCPPPPIFRRNGFQLEGKVSIVNGIARVDQVFSVNGIARVDGARLHELFNPSTLQLERDQKKAADEARRLFTKAFLAAQLKYYDIPFRSSHTRGDLLLFLQGAVSQGKCNNVPESVMQIEASMRADYVPLHQKWEADYAVWAAEKKQRDDEAFAKCKTPSERAKLDPQRFMDMYFLTDGKPDTSKTPEPLVLSGLLDEWRLRTMAEQIPGLHTSSGGSWSNRELCIGWYSAEVSALASRLTERAHEAEKAQQKAQSDREMARHRRYLDRLQEKSGESGGQPGEFDLARCLGSYIIQCDKIADEWPDVVRGHTLTMDISKGTANTLRATYDFGILEGTMTLNLSEEKLKAIFGDDSTDSEASQSNDDDHSEDVDDDDEGIDTHDSTGGKKRKAGEASLEQATDSAAPKAGKRRRTGTAPAPPRRVYFRLFGHETGEGTMIPDPDKGHIDFLDNSCTTFAGLVCHLTFVAKNVEFRGYKVSDTPRPKAEA